MKHYDRIMKITAGDVIALPVKPSSKMSMETPKFHDGKYNSAKDKENIYKALVRFIASDFDPRKFTKALYKQLSLHFGFIDHYDLGGFYHARFSDPDGRMKTFEAITHASQYNFNDENTSGNGDLNKAIQELVAKNKDAFVNKAKDKKVGMLLEQKKAIEEQLKKMGHKEVDAALYTKIWWATNAKHDSIAATTRTLKRDVKLKDGRLFPSGTPVTVKFLDETESKRGHLCELSGCQHSTQPLGVQSWKTTTARLSTTVSGFTEPSVNTMEKWVNDGVAKTMTGKECEPDGYGDDNSPSWLLVLGLI
jgi:hypothetical protein